MDDDLDLSHVCDTQPFCLCAGEGSEECCCRPVDQNALQTTCSVCGAKQVAIDFETGEPLKPGDHSSFKYA